MALRSADRIWAQFERQAGTEYKYGIALVSIG